MKSTNDRKDAYTVRVSDARRTLPRFEGDFRSYGAAEIHARTLADRGRASETFQVHRGTRWRPGRAVGPVFHASIQDRRAWHARRSERDFDKPALMKQIAKEQKIAERQKIANFRADIRTSVQQQRTVRQQCRQAQEEGARTIKSLRRKLAEERHHLAEMRRIERGRPRPLAKTRERREESDDEVRQNIPPDLIPLFERVKRSIKPGLRKSRTEAFLEYVEEHPGEEYEGIEDKTEALIRELEQRQRSGARDRRRRRDTNAAVHAEADDLRRARP